MAEFSILPFNDPCVRAAYHYIATGETQSSTWYRDLETPSSNPNIDSFIQEHRENVNTDSVTQEEVDPPNDENNDAVMENHDQISVEEEQDVESLKAEYLENYKLFETKIFSCLQRNDFLKSFRKFSLTLKKLSKSNDETLKRKLFDMSQNDTKTKRGKYIAVQPTAIARRIYKHRGRMVSSYGRRV